MNKLIIFLFRLKFRVRKFESFRFTNQKTQNWYHFTDCCLLKWDHEQRCYMPSNVKLNWLLDDSCEITRVRDIKIN